MNDANAAALGPPAPSAVKSSVSVGIGFMEHPGAFPRNGVARSLLTELTTMILKKTFLLSFAFEVLSRLARTLCSLKR